MKKKKNIIGLLTVIPVGCSILSAYTMSLWLAAVAFALVFVCVAVMPFCRKKESVWIFCLMAVTAIPINIFILIKCDIWVVIFSLSFEGKGAVYYLVFVLGVLLMDGVEEIFAGLIAHLFWRKQELIDIPAEEE